MEKKKNYKKKRFFNFNKKKLKLLIIKKREKEKKEIMLYFLYFFFYSNSMILRKIKENDRKFNYFNKLFILKGSYFFKKRFFNNSNLFLNFIKKINNKVRGTFLKKKKKDIFFKEKCKWFLYYNNKKKISSSFKFNLFFLIKKNFLENKKKNFYLNFFFKIYIFFLKKYFFLNNKYNKNLTFKNNYIDIDLYKLSKYNNNNFCILKKTTHFLKKKIYILTQKINNKELNLKIWKLFLDLIKKKKVSYFFKKLDNADLNKVQSYFNKKIIYLSIKRTRNNLYVTLFNDTKILFKASFVDFLRNREKALNALKKKAWYLNRKRRRYLIRKYNLNNERKKDRLVIQKSNSGKSIIKRIRIKRKKIKKKRKIPVLLIFMRWIASNLSLFSRFNIGSYNYNHVIVYVKSAMRAIDYFIRSVSYYGNIIFTKKNYLKKRLFLNYRSRFLLKKKKIKKWLFKKENSINIFLFFFKKNKNILNKNNLLFFNLILKWLKFKIKYNDLIVKYFILKKKNNKLFNFIVINKVSKPYNGCKKKKNYRYV